jgi:hypothetical protein
MKHYRLNRLFNPQSNRCFDVAVDHGFFNQPGFLMGIEDMRTVVKTLVNAAPDAIQLTLGMARHLQEIPGRFKPSLVLPTDVANIYGKELPTSRFGLMIQETMLQAVRFDAACVSVNLFQIPRSRLAGGRFQQALPALRSRGRTVLGLDRRQTGRIANQTSADDVGQALCHRSGIGVGEARSNASPRGEGPQRRGKRRNLETGGAASEMNSDGTTNER